MKSISIKPFDTLFFRDGRPFGMGEESFAQFVFPPFPTTFYGALRSKIIAENGGYEKFKNGKNPKLTAVAGTPNSKGSLQIIGPLLRKEGDFVLPLPADVFRGEDGKFKKVPPCGKEILPWKGKEAGKIAYLFLNGEKNALKADRTSLFKNSDFKEYLLGKGKFFSAVEKGEIYKAEPKVGIALEMPYKRVRRGYLYRLSMVRLRGDVDFVVFYQGTNAVAFPERGLLQIGGEGRAAFYREEEVSPPGLSQDEFEDAIKGKKFIKLYLLTPAFIHENGLPYLEKLKILGLKLVGYSVKGLLWIGGWDMAKGFPKPMRPAWSPGSILLFQFDDGYMGREYGKIYQEVNFKPVLCKPQGNEQSDDAKEGYGVVLLGVEDAA